MKMGTIVGVTVYGNDEARAQAALEAAYVEIDRIEKLMSRYSENSEVSRLNKTGLTPFKTSDELFMVIGESLKYSDMTEGAFDITVGPLMKVFRASLEKEKIPDENAVAKAASRVGFRKISLDSSAKTVTFESDGMEIDLGAIAKGYAADRAAAALKAVGAQSAIIDAGGDVLCIGSKPAEKPWTVALRNPRDPEDFLLKLAVKDLAVTTSGDYEQYFESNGNRFMHIMDPRTGKSATGCISATVIARTAMQADALSTSICVLGPADGIKLIEGIDDVEALIVSKDRQLFRSSGFSKFEAE
jgi:thiamine biosynthesis lipoprotein